MGNDAHTRIKRVCSRLPPPTIASQEFFKNVRGGCGMDKAELLRELQRVDAAKDDDPNEKGEGSHMGFCHRLMAPRLPVNTRQNLSTQASKATRPAQYKAAITNGEYRSALVKHRQPQAC
eukprot:CAMPEP_0176006754 /NCGR_PEP_ID=MMETSP0120_2-20121206/2884_1 /TAXON_ID=160619 /ORGANISM="Kryptoperidinium foliaceum, Strain CCMP 1326" /LENGTH=119 /DNA_ID=CAMNT_0017339501 /DNA_START=568 /DNA_END=925 /DNA_ORIENTATION=-